MRRRLARLLVFMLVLPLAAKVADALADRIEGTRGPTVPSRLLRRGSSLGRDLGKHGRL